MLDRMEQDQKYLSLFWSDPNLLVLRRALLLVQVQRLGVELPRLSYHHIITDLHNAVKQTDRL